jgi:hypothetical protein
LRINWNVALRKANEYMDRYAAALRMPNAPARDAAMSKIAADVTQPGEGLTASDILRAAVNPTARDAIVAAPALFLLLPDVQNAVQNQDGANNDLQRTRLAAALAVYRAEKGQYPPTLGALVPDCIDKLPVDSLHGLPYAYQRIDSGYLLYSFGPNGIDDGGSNYRVRLLNGQFVDYTEDANGDAVDPPIPESADDFAIRVPRPPIKLPKLVSRLTQK